jgi:hypothetical protein
MNVLCFCRSLVSVITLAHSHSLFGQSLLLQIGAKECILAPGGTRDEIEMKKLDALLERCGIMKTEVKKGLYLYILLYVRSQPQLTPGLALVTSSVQAAGH